MCENLNLNINKEKKNASKRSNKVRMVLPNILKEDTTMHFSDIVAAVESELSLSGLDSIVASVLKWGISKGLYTKESRAYYRKNVVVKFKQPVDSWRSSVTNAYISVSTSLNNLSLDLVGTAISEDTLKDFQSLSNISHILNACISYSVSNNIDDLKTVIDRLR